MDLNLNLINLCILFGAVQGLILSAILFFQRGHPGARFLSVFMLILAYNGFETFNWSSELYLTFPQFLSYVIIFGIGPSLYLYIATLLKNRTFSGRQVALFYTPFFIQVLAKAGIVVYLMLWTNGTLQTQTTPHEVHEWFAVISEPLSVVTYLVFLTFSIREYRHFLNKKIINDPVNSEERKIIARWAKAFLICMTVLGVFWPLTVLAPFVLDIPFDVHYYPIEISLVLFIYWIAFAGYHRVKIVYKKAERMRSSTFAAIEVEGVLAKLKKAMQEEKLYLDPELSLTKVSDHTGIPAKNVSAIVNQHLKKSFNEFVNNYRIEEVKHRLLNPDSKHLTISGIALEAGFNSQATFQRAFKNQVGMSPKEYMSFQLKNVG